MSGTLHNPFMADDPDRRIMWDMLVARDTEAFLAGDWSMVEPDFAADRFEGIHAHKSANPDDWTLSYPTLQAYRDDWLKGSETFRACRFESIAPRELFYKATSLYEIEIAGDRALGHKKFSADEPMAGGARFQGASQSLYRLHRVEGVWRIVGFVGYLPLQTEGLLR